MKIFREGFETRCIVLPCIEQQLCSVRQTPPPGGGLEFVLKNPLDEVGRIQPLLVHLQDRVGLLRSGRTFPSFKNIFGLDIGRHCEVIPRVQALELVSGNGFLVVSAPCSHFGKMVPAAADGGCGGMFLQIRHPVTPAGVLFFRGIARNESGLMCGGLFFAFLAGHPPALPRSCNAAKEDFAPPTPRGSYRGARALAGQSLTGRFFSSDSKQASRTFCTSAPRAKSASPGVPDRMAEMKRW